MNNNNRTLAILAIATIAAFLVTAAVMIPDNALAHSKKKTQTTAQANVCGEGTLPLAIFCQTLSNQIQGNDNAANMIGQQP
jgi:hypothetical protein